jgi:hypothetical protein
VRVREEGKGETVVTTPDRLDWFSCSKRLHVLDPWASVSYFQKGAPEQVDVHEGTWEGFWSMITGGDHQRRISIWSPSSKYVTLLCKWIFGENERDKDNQHGVELALLGFVVRQPIDPIQLMINRWCC